MRRVFALAFLLLAAPLSGCVGEGPDAPQDGPGAADDDQAAGTGPDWTFTDTDGVTHTRETAQGDAVVMFFFATWCRTCRALTGPLAQVHNETQDQNVRFLSVSFDRSETAQQLEAWKETYGQPWPHGRDVDGSMTRTFEIVVQSSVVVLDTHGVVVRKWGFGEANAESIRDAVETARGA